MQFVLGRWIGRFRGPLRLVGILGLVLLSSCNFPAATETALDTSPTPTEPPTPGTAPGSTVFHSAYEGFTLEVPSNWIIEETSDTNCGHEREVNGSTCWERYDFVAPDGIRVRYVESADENSDRIPCDEQSICMDQDVRGLETVIIEGLGVVYLVEEVPNSISLHLPLSEGTTPTLGINSHDDFMIAFGLPSKTGGRMAIFVTIYAGTAPAPPALQDLSPEEFDALPSVEQAIMVLKSLRYE